MLNYISSTSFMRLYLHIMDTMHDASSVGIYFIYNSSVFCHETGFAGQIHLYLASYFKIEQQRVFDFILFY